MSMQTPEAVCGGAVQSLPLHTFFPAVPGNRTSDLLLLLV